MSPSDLLKLPDAVLRAALETELALFESLADGGLDLESLRIRFLEILSERKVARPVYSRTTWSLDDYVQEYIEERAIAENDGILTLTPSGKSKLAVLQQEAKAAGFR